MDPSTPEAIVGDVTRLRQILVNLLSNAVKFTEQGEVVLTVSGRRLPAGDGDEAALYELHFTVRDTGIGIPPARRDRLFQSFSQVDASTTRLYGGTGLGLAISKRLCELMGGSMWVESEMQRGSTFHFTVQAQEAPAPAHSFLRDSHPQLEDRRLLVLDHTETMRQILTAQAAAWHMHARCTDSPEEALAWIREGVHFDVVIVDMQLWELNGETLGAALRRFEHGRTLPIVMTRTPGSQPRGTEAGEITAFLNKPFKPSHLFDALVQIFAGRPLRIERRQDQSVSLFDRQMATELPLRLLLVEDNATNQKVALRILERLGYRADVAANGQEALEMVGRRDYDVLLMDIQMPEMDGLEATRHIRGDLVSEKQPYIIAMTANATQGDRELSLQAGMNDYVSKPIRVEELVAALRRWQPYQAAAEPEQGPVAVASSERLAAPLDLIDHAAIAELRETMGGEGSYLIELIDSFFADAPRLLADMRRALELADAAGLRLAAHTLKSNSADFGLRPLHEVCKTLEAMGKDGVLDGAAALLGQAEQLYEMSHVGLEEIRLRSAEPS